jgi:hypothetical protein
MNRILFILFVLSTISYEGLGQILKPCTIEYTIYNRNINHPNILLISKRLAGNCPRLASTLNIKYSLPKGAIFCRMEDALYNRLNFWVKIRMGDDDRYSN